MPFALAPGLLPQFPLSTLSCGTDRDDVHLSARATRAVPAGAARTPAHRGQPRPAGPAERSPAVGRRGRAGAGRGRHPLAATAPAGTSRRPGTPAPGAGLARIRAAHRPHAHRGLTREADPRPEAGNTTNLILIWRPFPVQPALRHGHGAAPSRPVVDRARVLLKGRPSPRGISAARRQPQADGAADEGWPRPACVQPAPAPHGRARPAAQLCYRYVAARGEPSGGCSSCTSPQTGSDALGDTRDGHRAQGQGLSGNSPRTLRLGYRSPDTAPASHSLIRQATAVIPIPERERLPHGTSPADQSH